MSPEKQALKATLLLAVLAHVARASGATCREIAHFRPVRNLLPNSKYSPLSTATVPTHAQCGQLCLFLPMCASFTFHKDNGTCQMHYDDVTLNGTVASYDVGTVSAARSSIPQELAGDCLGRTCPDSHACHQRGRHGTFCRPVYSSLVRLVGGNSPEEGRVEVFLQGQWSTICNDFFDLSDVKVICRMLGLPFSSRSQAVLFGDFGPGTGPILLDDVACHGGEASILSCSRTRLPSNCQHHEDVGVRCLP